MSGFRADKWLHNRGHAASRAKAQELIKRGLVTLHFPDGKIFKPTKASESWPEMWGEPLKVEIEDSPLTQFVSRGGWKLSAAIDQVAFPVENLSFIDVGQSTGGFTDVLLQRGAKKVVGLDVGHGQLHSSLKERPEVVSLEGVHAAQVDPSALFIQNGGVRFEGWVSDVSFVSIEKILPLAGRVLQAGSRGLALIKPQFELGPAALNKKGVVKDPESYGAVEDKVLRICSQLGYKVFDYFPSSLEGSDGNQEFFVHFECLDIGGGIS